MSMDNGEGELFQSCGYYNVVVAYFLSFGIIIRTTEKRRVVTNVLKPPFGFAKSRFTSVYEANGRRHEKQRYS